MTIISQIVIFVISGLRPILGPAECRFPIGCTEYAIEKLKNEPFLKAFKAIFKRVLRCNPWSKLNPQDLSE